MSNSIVSLWAAESASPSDIAPVYRVHYIVLELVVLAKLCSSLRSELAASDAFHISIILTLRLSEARCGNPIGGKVLDIYNVVLDAATVRAQRHFHSQQWSTFEQDMSEAIFEAEPIAFRRLLHAHLLCRSSQPLGPYTDAPCPDLEQTLCALSVDETFSHQPSVYAWLEQHIQLTHGHWYAKGVCAW